MEWVNLMKQPLLINLDLDLPDNNPPLRGPPSMSPPSLPLYSIGMLLKDWAAQIIWPAREARLKTS